MKAGKVLLLILVVGLGAGLETAVAVRDRISLGPAGCRVLGGRFYGPSFTFEEQRRLEVPAALTLRVENAFGDVRVKAGAPGQAQVGLRKVVFLPTEERAREFDGRLRLEAALDGTSLHVTTNRAALERASGEVGFETHLEIEVPPGTRVEVEDEHGAVTVSDVAALRASNSFEPLRVERVAGDAELKARHGAVAVTSVGGALTLEARHGTLELREVAGRVSLDLEHGEATLEDSGAAEVQLKHGRLAARRLKAGLRLHGEHAEVVASEVSGAVEVETAFRAVRLRDVRGDVRVKNHHGEVEVESVTGSLSADASFESVVLAKVDGPVEVEVEHGGLRASRLGAGARVRSAGDNVVIEGFKGAIEVDAQRGDVTLSPEGPLRDAVSVKASNGAIRLSVPPGSGFELEATAHVGEVQLGDLSDLSLSESGPERAVGRVGAGGPSVRLETHHGDVSLDTRADRAARQ